MIACADADELENKRGKKKREKEMRGLPVPMNGAAQGLQELIPELRALYQVQMEQRLRVSEQPVPNCCLSRRRNRALFSPAETARRDARQVSVVCELA